MLKTIYMKNTEQTNIPRKLHLNNYKNLKISVYATKSNPFFNLHGNIYKRCIKIFTR